MDTIRDSEPLFNVKPPVTSGDHLEGWLFDLSAENDKAQRAVKKNKAGASGHFKHGIPVRLILLMCKKCRQPPEVRYQAIELYDHFMVRHVREVKRVWTAGGDGRTTWKAVVERLGHQVLLRVLTCIQIAGKLHAPKWSITVDTMQNLLKVAGREFTRKSIFKSELRVLREVAYKPAVTTPLSYLEALLEVLGHNDPTVNVRALYNVSLEILDLFYLHRTEAYESLFRRVSKPTSRDIEKKFISESLMPVTKDLMSLASAVISSAAYSLDPVGFVTVARWIQSITCIPFDEIVHFTVVIIGLWKQP